MFDPRSRPFVPVTKRDRCDWDGGSEPPGIISLHSIRCSLHSEPGRKQIGCATIQPRWQHLWLRLGRIQPHRHSV